MQTSYPDCQDTVLYSMGAPSKDREPRAEPIEGVAILTRDSRLKVVDHQTIRHVMLGHTTPSQLSEIPMANLPQVLASLSIAP